VLSRLFDPLLHLHARRLMSEPKINVTIGGTRLTLSMRDAVDGIAKLKMALDRSKVKCGACGQKTLPTAQCSQCGTTRS